MAGSETREGGATLPPVSVVMAVRNEAGSIGRTLESVLSQDYPPGLFEIVIADGCSNDGTLDAIATAIGQAPTPTVRTIENPARVTPAGLNAAIAAATGEVIVRVDGHCELPPSYVRECVRLLTETGAANVGGVVVAEGATPAGEAIAAAVSSPFGVGNARFRYSDKAGGVDTVPFGTWRRETLQRLGGFDEELVRNQDDELNFRLRQAGETIWLDPSIRVRYRSRASLSSLWRQYFEYGFYKVRVIQKRRGVATLRQLVPPAFVAGLAGSSLLTMITGRRRWIAAVALPYAAGLAVATAQAQPREPAVAARLPLAFVTLHVGYGSGFLAGLWRWRKLWR